MTIEVISRKKNWYLVLLPDNTQIKVLGKKQLAYLQALHEQIEQLQSKNINLSTENLELTEENEKLRQTGYCELHSKRETKTTSKYGDREITYISSEIDASNQNDRGLCTLPPDKIQNNKSREYPVKETADGVTRQEHGFKTGSEYIESLRREADLAIKATETSDRNLQEGFDTIQEGFDTIQDGFDAIQERFDAIQDGFDAIQEGHEELNKCIIKVSEAVHRTAKAFDALECETDRTSDSIQHPERRERRIYQVCDNLLPSSEKSRIDFR